MGLILGYLVEAEKETDKIDEALHHEAAHMLRAHAFGWPISSVAIELLAEPIISLLDIETDLVGHTIYAGRRGGFYWSDDEQVEISLAGPLASLKFLADKPVWPPIKTNAGESNAELRMWLREEVYWKCGRRKMRFPDLTGENYRTFQLGSDDDFSQAFDALISLHHYTFERIPTIRTLLRQYRIYEVATREWVNQHWGAISDLAHYIRENSKQTPKYTHYMGGKSFYAWVKGAGRIYLPSVERHLRGKSS